MTLLRQLWHYWLYDFMKFTISGEISALQPNHSIPEKFDKARQKVIDTLNQSLNNNNYGDAINSIFLAPMILQADNSFFALKKERKLIKHKEKTVDFRLRINYLDFALSNDEKRERLLIKNVVDAVRIIKKRLKNKFNGEDLERDILSLWSLNYSDLEQF